MVTMIAQHNLDADLRDLNQPTTYCERHGMEEAHKYYEDRERLSLVAPWEPQDQGREVAQFDLMAPNLPGSIHFTRFEPWGHEECAACGPDACHACDEDA